MTEDKIENNPSFIKIKQEMEKMGFFIELNKSLPLLKPEALGKLSSDFDKIKKNFEIISKQNDKFNKYFSSYGWISYESMNSEISDKAMILAEEGNIEAAELILVDYYESDKIKHLVKFCMSYPKEFELREEMVKSAYECYKEKNYYTCIPLLLIIIDGIVYDINKNKGFFAKGTNLTAWDSIAAHSTGLSKLSKIFTKTRIKTNTNMITLPYRNGILHGRDLGYANKFVAAKCWATLFALRDWALAIKKEKTNNRNIL